GAAVGSHAHRGGDGRAGEPGLHQELAAAHAGGRELAREDALAAALVLPRDDEAAVGTDRHIGQGLGVAGGLVDPDRAANHAAGFFDALGENAAGISRARTAPGHYEVAIGIHGHASVVLIARGVAGVGQRGAGDLGAVEIEQADIDVLCAKGAAGEGHHETAAAVRGDGRGTGEVEESLVDPKLGSADGAVGIVNLRFDGGVVLVGPHRHPAAVVEHGDRDFTLV